MAGPGQPQSKALSGEEEIVQSLVEGINTVAYPKAMVKRKAPKVSLVGATPTSSTAEAASAAAPSGVCRECLVNAIGGRGFLLGHFLDVEE